MHPSSNDVLGHLLATTLLHQLLVLLAVAVVVAFVVAGLALRGFRVEQAGAVLVGGRSPTAEPGARRFLRIGFALLWLVCGALQAQSGMPGGFVSHVVEADLSAQPGWLADLGGPLTRAWVRHPISSDAITVWVQVGLGILLLVAVRRVLAVLACSASIAWSVVVWLIGEHAGGLFSAGATFTAGSPGAVLLYAVAGGLLVLPWDWWSDGRAQVLARRIGSGWLAIGAVLHAIPGERAWTSSGASAPFAAGSANSQPEALRWPITRLASLAASSPALVNATMVCLLAAAALALWWSGRPAVVTAVVVLCLGTWWLAQDFGVLGGYGTDPNSALPLAVLVALALPVFGAGYEAAPVSVPSSTGTRLAGNDVAAHSARVGAARAGCLAALVAIGGATALALPAGLASALPSPADANAVRADSGGGILSVPGRPAPAFDFTDQRGARTSLAGLQGKIVVLTFLDAVCSTDCPLIANQLGVADRRLGALADRVEFVAVDSNPVFRFRRDVAAFTDSHGLGGLRNWHFVTGAPEAVQAVLGRYGITVQVPTVGMIEHTDAIYFITGAGREAAYLDDGALAELTDTYADEIYAQVRALLR